MDPERLSKAVLRLVDLVEKLRGPGGCPWDAKQTDSTIRLYLLEEAYEVLDAIEKASAQDVCQELGDLLFHILFLARLAEERDEFDLTEVVERITEKMIRRHPHVFGKTSVESADDVAINWAMIKKQEKKESGDNSSFLNGIPVDLPALLRAHRLGERASRANLEASDSADAWDIVLNKFEALKDSVSSQDKDKFGQDMGTFLFCLVSLARLWGVNSEHLLRAASNEFIDRIENDNR